MLASYLRRLIFILFASSAMLAAFLWKLSPGLAVFSLFSIALGFSLVLAIQFACAAYSNRLSDVPPASAWQLFDAWLFETWIAFKVFLWWLPFCSHRYPDKLSGCMAPKTSRGVVLVHGFVCNRGIWRAWYPVLDRMQIPYLAVNLEPVLASIDSYCGLLDDAVRSMHDEFGRPPLLICHSMGGLVARAWLSATNVDARVHRIVTIGSPHHGTNVGNWAPRWSFLTNAHQMRAGARWLTALASQETSVRRSNFVCFYSNCDNIVFPAKSATLHGADNRHVPGVPHVALAQDPRIIEQSLALL